MLYYVPQTDLPLQIVSLIAYATRDNGYTALDTL
jgi:hypothetical protein